MGRHFAGASTQYYAAPAGLPDRTSTLTVGCWFYLTVQPGTGTYNAALAKGPSGGSTGRNHAIEYAEFFGRRLQFTWYGAAGVSGRSVATGNLALLRWYHLVCAVDWTTTPDTVAMYLNGAPQSLGLIGSNNDPPNLSGTQLTEVGRNPEGAASQYWNNRLAEVFATPAVLTAAQAAALWQGQTPDRLGVPLDGYWPLRGAGSLEPDLSGNGRHLVPTGPPYPTAHPYALPARPIGRPGRFWVGAPPAAAQDTPELAGRPFGRWGSRHTQQALAF